jgi:hypothetical protein
MWSFSGVKLDARQISKNNPKRRARGQEVLKRGGKNKNIASL